MSKKTWLTKKAKQAIWRGLLVLGLIFEFMLIGMILNSMLQHGEPLPHWKAVTFVAIAVWIYIAYLKQRSIDISRFVVDEKIKSHLLAQHLTDGLIVLDDEARVILWNVAASMITGIAELQALNRPIGELLEPSGSDWLAPGRAGECRAVTRDAKKPLRLRVVHLERDGSATGQKLVYVYPVRSSAPAVTGWKAAQLLQAAVTAETLAAALPAGPARLDGRRLGLDLRSLSLHAGSADELFASRVNTPVQDLLQWALNEVGPAAASAGVEVRAAEVDPSLQTFGDPAWMRAALLQTLLNALLASRHGQLVDVKAAAMGMHTGVLVADEAPAPDDLAGFFEWPRGALADAAGRPLRQDAPGLFLARLALEKQGGILSAATPAAGGLQVTLLLPGPAA